MWNRAHNVSKPRLIDVDRPASEAVPNDPDSDFDDPAPLPPKKRAKKESKPNKHVPKAVPRINACGVKNLDRTLLEVRDNDPNSQFTLCLLSESLKDVDAVHWCAPASLFVAKTRDGTSYRLTADEDDLDENEFMGLFASGPYDRADPGVCDEIIKNLEMGEHHYVVVVDASERGTNLARLAAGVAMLKWARACKAKDEAAFLRNASRNAQLPKPTDTKWKAALTGCARGRSWAEVREHAREWFLSL
tara:strand:- start:2389 stop:3129 length:741 start_codon:yes stop_codon:yes gene_type:complete